MDLEDDLYGDDEFDDFEAGSGGGGGGDGGDTRLSSSGSGSGSGSKSRESSATSSSHHRSSDDVDAGAVAVAGGGAGAPPPRRTSIQRMRSVEQMQRLAQSAKAATQGVTLPHIDSGKKRETSEYEEIIDHLKKKNDHLRGKLKEFSGLLDAQINARTRDAGKHSRRMQQASYQPSAATPATMRDKQMTMLHKKLRVYKLENERLQKHIQETLSANHVVDLENALRAEDTKLKAAEDEIKVLQADRRRMMAEFEALTNAQSEYPSVIKSLRDEVRAYKKKMRELATLREQSEKASRQRHEYTNKLESRVRELENKRISRKGGGGGGSRTVSRAESVDPAKMDQLQRDVDSLRKQLQDQLMKREADTKRNRKAIDKEQKKYEELQTQCADLKKKHDKAIEAAATATAAAAKVAPVRQASPVPAQRQQAAAARVSRNRSMESVKSSKSSSSSSTRIVARKQSTESLKAAAAVPMPVAVAVAPPPPAATPAAAVEAAVSVPVPGPVAPIARVEDDIVDEVIADDTETVQQQQPTVPTPIVPAVNTTIAATAAVAPTPATVTTSSLPTGVSGLSMNDDDDDEEEDYEDDFDDMI